MGGVRTTPGLPRNGSLTDVASSGDEEAREPSPPPQDNGAPGEANVEIVPAEFVDDVHGERLLGTVKLHRSYSGPIPPHDIAAGWRELVPDAPERMLRMAEAAQQHRAEMDRRRQDSARTGVIRRSI